jgi:hypothetical protein
MWSRVGSVALLTRQNQRLRWPENADSRQPAKCYSKDPIFDLFFAVYWVYSGFDRSPEIQKDGAAIYGECNCSVARSGPRDGGRWRNVPRLY